MPFIRHMLYIYILPFDGSWIVHSCQNRRSQDAETMSSNVIARYVDKRSGKDTSLACLDRNFVPAPPVWLREEIQRDTGATGIIKIGDQGRHSEDKVTPVESNHHKCTVVSRSKPPFGTIWRAGDAGCGLTLQPNFHPPQKRNRQTATSNESKPQKRS